MNVENAVGRWTYEQKTSLASARPSSSACLEHAANQQHTKTPSLCNATLTLAECSSRRSKQASKISNRSNPRS